MNQQVGLDFAGGAQREFLVRAVHRVAGLERDDLAPAELLEALANFGGRVAQVLEIVVRRLLNSGELAANVNRITDALQVVDSRVLRA